MKKILIALAGVAALAAPLAAQAQARGGGHGGGFHGGGGFRGGGFRGGFGGGFYRGGFYPGYYYYGAAGLGFGLGLALADPWYYGPGYYGYYGYYGPPAVVYADPAYGYAPPPTVGAAPQAACGQWSWDQAHSKYNWIPGPCAPAAAPSPAGTD